jgi:hypothetical protein
MAAPCAHAIKTHHRLSLNARACEYEDSPADTEVPGAENKQHEDRQCKPTAWQCSSGCPAVVNMCFNDRKQALAMICNTSFEAAGGFA